MARRFLVEVGANDGILKSKSRELILTKDWSGLFIEPIKFYFDKLVSNYANNNNTYFLNIGISSIQGKKTIYRINPDFLDDNSYGHGVNSLNRNHKGIMRLEKQFGTDSLIAETIDCFPLSMIFEDRNITNIDLLIIDTEGYDFNVIQSIDFKKVKPNEIIYENKHLNEINNECEKYLKSLGYIITRKNTDTYCNLA